MRHRLNEEFDVSTLVICCLFSPMIYVFEGMEGGERKVDKNKGTFFFHLTDEGKSENVVGKRGPPERNFLCCTISTAGS